MSVEIGSEFWDVPVTDRINNVFDNISWFISGRAALRAIIKDIISNNNVDQTITIAIPSYLCESMIEPLVKESVNFKFYEVSVGENGLTYDFSNINNCNVVLLIDYFGFQACFYHKFDNDPIIIRDLTHSLFVKEYSDADYYFGSLRKWAGFKCGGFAFKNAGTFQPYSKTDEKYIQMRCEAMDLKKQFITNKTTNKDHLFAFRKAEERLSDCAIFSGCPLDIDEAKHLDISFIKKKRRDNAKYLIDHLNKYCLFKQIGNNDCPLFVPILVNNRDDLRNYLIDHNVYCPIHWPKPFDVPSLSDFLYKHELSLVCDQRYDINDMEKIVKLINDFMEKENA